MVFVLQQALGRLLSPVHLILLAIAAISVGISGPFGTYYSMSTLPRLVYWAVVILSSVVTAFVIEEYFQQKFPAKYLLLREAAVVLVFTLVFLPVLTGLNLLVVDWRQSDGLGIMEMAGVVAGIAVVMRLIRLAALPKLILGRVAPQAEPVAVPHDPEPEAEPDGPGRMRIVATAAQGRGRLSPLIRRLEIAPGTRIAAMSVDDHYVEVRDSAGRKHRLLMRFSDAVTEAEGLGGQLVHRSHWVARWAVRGHQRRGNREFVILVDGRAIPLSRTYRAALFAALPDLPSLPPTAQAGSVGR